MLTELEFNSLADQGYHRIPLMVEILADLDTPLSLYLKLTGGPGQAPYSFLLESVVDGERFGRYSFIGLPARTILRASGFGTEAVTEVLTDGAVVETSAGNPLDFIAAYRQRFKVALPSGLPRFCGGLAGYFGYDTVRHIEPRLAGTCPPDTLGTPDILLMHSEELAVIDNLSGKLYLIVYADPAQREAYTRARRRLRALRQRLWDPVPIPRIAPTATQTAERSFAKEDFLASVQRAKALIAAGDCMQVEVGQRLSKPYTGSPLSLYRAVRSLNPSPYMIYYDFDDFHVVSSSPEILVRIENMAAGADAADRAGGAGDAPLERKVTIRPLAGTRPRGSTLEADRQIEQELLADPKERAEHVMLIDLARNDIGRIAKTGSVKVTQAFGVERYSHVMHIVSNVEGLLQDDLTAMDVLRATFPAGTLSGAPKVRAMELIDELEPVKRGIYGGACGYWSYAGDMDLAIAIRTAIVRDGVMHAQAAAGVVADSDPEMEWRETEHKVRALLRASELVEEGLE